MKAIRESVAVRLAILAAVLLVGAIVIGYIVDPLAMRGLILKAAYYGGPGLAATLLLSVAVGWLKFSLAAGVKTFVYTGIVAACLSVLVFWSAPAPTPPPAPAPTPAPMSVPAPVIPKFRPCGPDWWSGKVIPCKTR